MWKEMLNIETGGKRDVGKLADIVMNHRRLEKRWEAGAKVANTASL